jgi:hypothetical protein
MNGRPHVILALLVGLKKSLMAQRLIRIIEEILEVDFRSFKTLLLKVQWFRNTA